MKNCKTILQLSTDFLIQHKVDRARLVAETLLAHFLRMERIDLYMHFDRPLEEDELAPFRAALKRAIKGEPLEYIIGEVPFFDVPIKVSSAVLIPRPETEILLDLVCNRLTGNEKKALDLCTGSGCLAAGLSAKHPELEVVGVDLSPDALAIARQNSSKVRWLEGDLTAPVQGERFDLVLCNPPYVTAAEYEELAPSVKQFEPKMALVSGASGYEFYERLEKELSPILAPGAQVFFEIGTGQGERLIQIFSGDFWEDLQVERDWAGHTRYFSLKVKQNSPIMG